MRQYLIIAALAFIIAWFLLTQHDALAPPPGISTYRDDTRIAELEQRVQSLSQTLDQELLLRQKLERRLQQLEQGRLPDPGAPEDLPSTPPQQNSEEPAKNINLSARGEQQQQNETNDIGQRLVNAGLASQTVQQIREVIDDTRLQRLQLRDQAIREGWRDSPEFTAKMHELGDPAEQVRERFGDAAYDRYLYALERPNRVRVREVMRGSAAEQAGVRAGDIIERYADTSIYSMSALRQATTEGVAGESVLLEIKREQQPFSTVLPRGPLGISMDFIRVEPK